MRTVARTRVAMVWPHRAVVGGTGVVALRAAPRDEAELVDEAHWGETVCMLGALDDWRYVQAEDHYFGWLRAAAINELSVYGRQHVITSLVAPVHDRPDRAAPVIARLPAGTRIPSGIHAVHDGSQRREIAGPDLSGWHSVFLFGAGAAREGHVSPEDATPVADLSHRPPTADDLIATARAFLGTPYLWGGTSGDGIDCSGFVQQVYRLNGVGLDRDADQQALEGRPVDAPVAGDLLFFGSPGVTHVALSLGADDFIHAPMRGGAVEERKIGPDRTPVSIRRYLLEGLYSAEGAHR